MPRVTRVAKARKDQGCCSKCGKPIKAGDPYVWWQNKTTYGGIRRNRCKEAACYPKASDLTTSAFRAPLYALQEQLESASCIDDIREIVDELRSLGEEQQEKFDNLPEGFQQGDTGQLLEERANGCEEAASELESQADDWESEWPENREDHDSADDYEDDDAYTEAREEAFDELKSNLSIDID